MSRRPASFITAPRTLPPVAVPDPSLWVRGYVSIKHAAEFLDVNRSWVVRRMKRGVLPWKRIDGLRRISRVALEAMGEEMKGEG